MPSKRWTGRIRPHEKQVRRTTRIRTRDQRSAIVPNSRIGSSQVINYTSPDPNYRVYSDIGVAYGSDFDQVRQVVNDAVRGVEGVLPDQPVDALFHGYGVSARTVRVRWWINNMYEEKHITDQVNEALEVAFDKAGIEMPVTKRLGRPGRPQHGRTILPAARCDINRKQPAGRERNGVG